MVAPMEHSMAVLLAFRLVALMACCSAGSMVAPMEHSMAVLLALRLVALMACRSADLMDDSLAGL